MSDRLHRPHAPSRRSLALARTITKTITKTITMTAVMTAALGGGPFSTLARAQGRLQPGALPGNPAGSPLKPPVKMPLQLPAKPVRPLAATSATPPRVPVAAPRGAPELESLRFLMGKWHCDGKQFASAAFGPEHVFKAVAENKATVDGAWDEFLYEEKASREHVGVKVHALWGWEAASRRLVRATVSSDGTWDFATSPGIDGNKVVWMGDFSTALGKLPFRHTFTKKSDTEWAHALEMKDAAGKWSATSQVSCKR